MAAHTLHFTIVGSTFREIEDEAARRVSAYCGWKITESREWIQQNAQIDAHPTGHTLDGDTLGYTAEVKVIV